MRFIHGLIFGLGLGGLTAAMMEISPNYQELLVFVSLLLVAIGTICLIPSREETFTGESSLA